MARHFRWFGLIVLLLPVSGAAQENAWISPVGGNWHDPYWSLGALPSLGQAICLTNAGSKEVQINHRTAQRFPGTLEMDQLTISAPAGSFNTLVLDKLGTRHAVTAGAVIILNNGAMVIDRSHLEAPIFGVGGSVIQEGEVSSERLYVSFGGPGQYLLKRGTLLVSLVENIGGNLSGLMVQEGGTHLADAVIHPNGEFQLKGGDFQGSLLIRKGATFHQQGGTFYTGNSTQVSGEYLQSGGAIIAPEASMFIPAYPPYMFDSRSSAEATQIGGTHERSNLTVGLPWMPSFGGENLSGGCYNVPDYGGTYRLVEGELVTSSTVLEPNGFIDQSGGYHLVTEGMRLRSSIYVVHVRRTTNVHVACVRSSGYHITGGTLDVPDLSIGPGASFVQDGGRTIVRGTLWTSGFHAYDFVGAGSRCHLLSGSIIVSNLVIQRAAQVVQTGAELLARNMQVFGNSFRVTEKFTCEGLLEIYEGELECGEGNHRLGQLMISGSSSVSFPDGKCVLRFDDSRDLAWNTTARLAIQGWAGSINGGGGHQILFGKGRTGLRPSQLSQISFIEPVGLPSGNYSAQMLANGEVVPAL